MNLEIVREEVTPDFYWDQNKGDDSTGDGTKENPWRSMSHTETQMSIGQIARRIEYPGCRNCLTVRKVSL